MAGELVTALQAKSSRPPQFLEIEEQFLRFVLLSRAAKIPLKQDVLVQRTLLARKQLVEQYPSGVDMDTTKSFSGRFDGRKSL